MNCYYSNLIEGHNTHPVDIERAMKNDYSGDPEKRNLQLEAKAHVAVQRWVDEGGVKGRAATVAAICEIHRRFSELLPKELLMNSDPESGRTVNVAAGELRRGDVKVGRHLAISPGAVPRFMTRFEEVYAAIGRSETILAVRAVERRAWPTGTEVRLIAVDEGIAPTGTAKLVPKAAAWMNESNAARVAQLTDKLQRMTTTLTGVGLKVSADIVKGSAQQVLCDEALQCTADCIFVGAPRVTGGIRRLREGSVSLALVTRAPCSVEIVRRREP